jgi:hypothetical protein
MERPQNREGSCLGTWEGPADGRSRLAAFFFFAFFFFFGFLGLNFPSWLKLAKMAKIVSFFFFWFPSCQVPFKNKIELGIFFQISLLGSSNLAKNVKDA